MNAEQTKKAIRAAMKIYETIVLDPRSWDAEREVFRYPYRISEADLLRKAGIKSRSTLAAAYHADIKKELVKFVADLKVKTGKGGRQPDGHGSRGCANHKVCADGADDRRPRL